MPQRGRMSFDRPEDLLYISELAKRLRCSEKVVRAAVRSGELKSYTTGSQRQRVFAGDAIAWIRTSREVAPTATAAGHLHARRVVSRKLGARKQCRT